MWETRNTLGAEMDNIFKTMTDADLDKAFQEMEIARHTGTLPTGILSDIQHRMKDYFTSFGLDPSDIYNWVDEESVVRYMKGGKRG